MIEDLAGGNKIFVFKSARESLDNVMIQISDLMSGFGPANLLWVTECKDSARWGHVFTINEHLMHGFIDRFAERDRIRDRSDRTWMTICYNAFRIWRTSCPRK
jgi:hypothetical protein